MMKNLPLILFFLLNFSMYSFSFVPDLVGDYIVIIKNTIDGQDYYAHDNFTVTNGIMENQILFY